MACKGTVAMVLGTLLALTQTEVVQGGIARAQVSSFSNGAASFSNGAASFSNGGSSFGKGAAQSHVTELDGTVKGECAYLDTQGRSIRISYKQAPNGQVQAAANPPVQDPVGALESCRRAAEVAAKATHDSIMRTQQEIFRQHQDLQQQIFRQNQALQQSLQFPPVFNIPNNFPFGHQIL